MNAWNNKNKYKSIYLNTNIAACMAGKWLDLRRKFILFVVDSGTRAYLQVLQQPLGKNVTVP